MITNKNDSQKQLQIKVIVTNGYKFSSNVNEVIRSVLNFLVFILFIYLFFCKKIFTNTKKHKTANKQKNEQK